MITVYPTSTTHTSHKSVYNVGKFLTGEKGLGAYIVRRRWLARVLCSGSRWRWDSWNADFRRAQTRSCWVVSTSDNLSEYTTLFSYLKNSSSKNCSLKLILLLKHYRELRSLIYLFITKLYKQNSNENHSKDLKIKTNNDYNAIIKNIRRTKDSGLKCMFLDTWKLTDHLRDWIMEWIN